jgi:GTP cyclohydrolase N terminal
MDWGNKDPQQRGPVVVSRTQTTIRRRNGKFAVSYFDLVLTWSLAIGGEPLEIQVQL